MKLTADLSLYPIQDDYVSVIDAFIEALRATDGIDIVTNSMSTQICGDYDRVFETVSRVLAASQERFGNQVLVVKFIPGEHDLRP